MKTQRQMGQGRAAFSGRSKTIVAFLMRPAAWRSLVGMIFAVQFLLPLSAQADSPCGRDGERACCEGTLGKKDERSIKNKFSGLSDCEADLYQIPGCKDSNKSGSCKCDNNPTAVPTYSLGTCRSPKWVVAHTSEAERKMVQAAKKALDDAEKAAEDAKRKTEAEAKAAAEQFARGATAAAAEAKRIGDQVGAELARAFTSVNEEAVCRAVLGALRGGRTPGSPTPGTQFVAPALAAAVNAAAQRVSTSRLTKPQYDLAMSNVKTRYDDVKQDVVAFKKTMMQQNKAIADAFSPDILCVPKALESKLKAMVKPAVGGSFFTSQALSVGASGFVGVQFSIAYVYNWSMTNPEYGVFLSVGPVMTPVTVGAGGSYGIQFFPSTKFSDFSGLGYGIGASVGTPGIEASVGADFSFPFPFDPWKPLPTGFGFNVGTGLNALGAPAEGSAGISQSWKLWSYPAK